MDEPLSTDASQSDLRIDNLPEILDFHEDKSPLLVETRRRLEAAAKKRHTDQAEAIANTYKETAKAYLEQSVARSKTSTASHRARVYGGMLINLARIWKRLGLRQQCLAAIDDALQFCQQRRWDSVAVVLESEKSRLLSSNA